MDEVSATRPYSRNGTFASRAWSRRQQEIIGELETIFLAEGFRHLTVGHLAERLRCSRRTIYGLTTSKEQLVALVVDRLFNRMGQEAHDLVREQSEPQQRIEAYLSVAVKWSRTASPVFLRDMQTHLPTKQVYDRHQQIAIRILQGFIEEGVQSGVFRPVHSFLVAQILDAAITRLREQQLLTQADMSHSAAVEELSQLLHRGLMRPAGAPAE